MLPAMAARVSVSPPRETAFRRASSKFSASRKASRAWGTDLHRWRPPDNCPGCPPAGNPGDSTGAGKCGSVPLSCAAGPGTPPRPPPGPPGRNPDGCGSPGRTAPPDAGPLPGWKRTTRPGTPAWPPHCRSCRRAHGRITEPLPELAPESRRWGISAPAAAYTGPGEAAPSPPPAASRFLGLPKGPGHRQGHERIVCSPAARLEKRKRLPLVPGPFIHRAHNIANKSTFHDGTSYFHSSSTGQWSLPMTSLWMITSWIRSFPFWDTRK